MLTGHFDFGYYHSIAAFGCHPQCDLLYHLLEQVTHLWTELVLYFVSGLQWYLQKQRENFFIPLNGGLSVWKNKDSSLRPFHVVESLYMVLTTDECVIRDTSAKFSIFWFHGKIIFTEETSYLFNKYCMYRNALKFNLVAAVRTVGTSKKASSKSESLQWFKRVKCEQCTNHHCLLYVSHFSASMDSKFCVQFAWCSCMFICFFHHSRLYVIQFVCSNSPNETAKWKIWKSK